MNTLGKLLNLLVAVAELLRRWRKFREHAKHEQESAEIQRNPGAWMDSHFNGRGAGSDAGRVPNPADSAAMPTNASHAGKTEPAGPDGKP